MTLVIMAAGMGSRFGGLKQVEPVGPNGEFILDYSIYDAIKAGYDKVVFIIKEENYDLFRETIGKRIESKIKVEYAFQKIEDVPDGVKVPKERVKPWGTSHAILSAKKYVNEPFTVINADDFYGYDPFLKIKNFFEENNDDNLYAMIGYRVINTMSENGSVKRGICSSDKDGYLNNLVESSIERKDSKIIATPLDDDTKQFIVDDDSLVSMNFFGFTPSIFKYLEDEMVEFFEKNKDNLDKCEFLIPNSVFKRIKENKIKVKVLDTDEKWFGVTYKEDKKDLVAAINKMIDEGKYPKNLWN
ncbi:MAG TPA: nucleotidyltransferase [Candidatus Aphodocola excrementigallinarum]|uniref:Nucleotidyltransferase n=1 Tax=Candidatus Aphodocola excrementigallinarum TaxID=2840670 RepID=A0A9D1IPY2_9FIRM|nr:nucleotidyltransferase [Candidatus Aphodocola excrementigallinarum]